MSDDNAKFEDRRHKAVRRYETQVAFFEKGKNDARRYFYALQTVVIVCSSLTPVLILAGTENWIPGTCSALAAIAAAVSALFQFQGSWLRRADTVESLRSEFHLFDTRTGEGYQAPASEEAALDRFITRTEQVYESERGEWKRSRPTRDSGS
jgi:Protein of unknown function (DUF4231)